MFFGFTNTDLIKLCPDLIDMPDVTIQHVNHILYFSILHFGACMPNHYAFQDESRELDWPTLVYVGALRAIPAWQREATGTRTDSAAGMLLALTASEHFDFALAWQMIELSSNYAKKIQLHATDLDHSCDRPGVTDNERRDIWDLVSKNLVYRLLFNKLPGIGGDPSDWHVNLPRLDDTNTIGSTHGVPNPLAIVFLIRSRLTLTLMEHFQIMRTDNPEMIIDTTERLCLDLLQTYDGWPIVSELSA
ncbi:hypothetical protein GT037_010827 [Alternaria burnsii]|uniref:Transcription factor domain-containing protein n=1 Tax=Alternaria burnsii TaxID=1187904 RepID=A0A8H7AV10_9PLEO|nr:uncharacterized protein GT037_010827 [Alternaria burnsii]KAF7671046.1 hypothetical protein GT037_010827 [Alternaria burnsii]